MISDYTKADGVRYSVAERTMYAKLIEFKRICEMTVESLTCLKENKLLVEILDLDLCITGEWEEYITKQENPILKEKLCNSFSSFISDWTMRFQHIAAGDDVVINDLKTRWNC